MQDNYFYKAVKYLLRQSCTFCSSHIVEMKMIHNNICNLHIQALLNVSLYITLYCPNIPFVISFNLPEQGSKNMLRRSPLHENFLSSFHQSDQDIP